MTKPNNTLATYEQLADSYHAKIDTKPHNAYYDRPNTLSLLPDVAGKKVLDAGCGPGKYAEILLAQGAEVTGIDLSPRMIHWASVRNGANGHFFVHDLQEPLPFDQEAFDVVICPLVLDYIANWSVVFQEFYRVLKPGGMLVFSVTHPFFDYTFFESQNYFEKEAVSCVWKGFDSHVTVRSYRRSMMDCINPLLEAGFVLGNLLEPKPTEEFARQDARHYEELSRFPSFLCVQALKVYE